MSRVEPPMLAGGSGMGQQQQPVAQARVMLLHSDHIHVKTDASTGVATVYDTRGAKQDLRHMTLNFRYFRISLYWLLLIAWIMRGVCFVVALLTTGALLMAEIMLLSCFVEPMILILCYTRHRLSLFAAKYLSLASLMAKAFYLTYWWYQGRRYTLIGASAWWWVAFYTLLGYTAVDVGILYCMVNIIKAKSAYCCLINTYRRVGEDRRRVN